MKPIRRTRAIAVALLLTLALSACDDSDLHRLAKIIRDTSEATATLQETVIQANQTGLLTDAEARPFVAVSIQTSRALLQSVAMTRELQKLDTVRREQLLVVLKPVVDSVSAAAMDPAISKISNPQTRAKVQASITLIQASLSTAQLILAVK